MPVQGDRTSYRDQTERCEDCPDNVRVFPPISSTFPLVLLVYIDRSMGLFAAGREETSGRACQRHAGEPAAMHRLSNRPKHNMHECYMDKYPVPQPASSTVRPIDVACECPQ